MNRHRLSTVWLIAVALGACERSAASRPTAAPAPTVPTKAATQVDTPREPAIDAARMHATLVALADDRMQGRATFQPEIGQAAELIANAYRDAEIAPVGTDYRTGYTIATGATAKQPPALSIAVAGKSRTIAPELFVARSASGNGKVEGELVFVGYAARSTEKAGTPAYDDLAGVDVTGRIAVVLLGNPGQADVDELIAAMRKRVAEHEAAMVPVRARGDVAAAKKQHTALRRSLQKLVARHWRGAKPPAVLREAPADPLAPYELAAVLERLRAEADALPGPAFDRRSTRLRQKLVRLAEAGAAGAIAIDGPGSHIDLVAHATEPLPSLTAGAMHGEPAKFPVVQLRWSEADVALRKAGFRIAVEQSRIDKQLKPRSRVLTGSSASIEVELAPIEQSAENVLARIDGSDLANEIVIVGAHFDHIGIDGRDGCHAKTRADGSRDEICNGADDNGSGTAVVLELARAFAAAGVRPRRTIVFAHFSGEEIGLHGSKALAESPPKAAPFDRGKVVAMINLDMVGRLGDAGLAVGGLGSSSGWMPLLERIGTGGMNVVYERGVTTRSDHASFYRKQVPVLFFFTGLHADYHGPGDEIDRISHEGMVKIASLGAALLLAVADGAALPFTEPAGEGEGLTDALPGTNATTSKPPPAAGG